MPALFEPFRLKSITLRNRIGVSPMCQYSSVNGHATDWHLVHLGSRAVGGAGLVIAEATAVSPEGRISPGDAGLWADSQIEPLARINRFVKSHGAVPGIQLAHAGRKASAQRPWEGDGHLSNESGGWDILAPSAEPFGGYLHKRPTEMSTQAIQQVQRQFVDAAKRSLEAGYEWLELHFAHGYLAHSFYSPLSNKRTDLYGGSFENRTRFLVDTLRAVRKVWPEHLPLTARLSVTDWIEGGITIEESIELARRFKTEGLDLLDVSHGFVVPDLSKIPFGPAFLVPHASRIRREAGIPVAAGWFIRDAQQADGVVREDKADLILLAKGFLDDAYWPFHAAKALGQASPQQVLPIQYAHWLKS